MQPKGWTGACRPACIANQNEFRRHSQKRSKWKAPAVDPSSARHGRSGSGPSTQRSRSYRERSFVERRNLHAHAADFLNGLIESNAAAAEKRHTRRAKPDLLRIFFFQRVAQNLATLGLHA